MTGDELRALREEWGMSQRELATLLDYHQQTISEMERGKKAVPQMLEKYLLSEKKLREIKGVLCTSSSIKKFWHF